MAPGPSTSGSLLSSSSSLVIRRLYRNLLRAVKPFTEPSPDARVLTCLLHRTGIDDHIGDWDAFVVSNPDAVDPHDRARDLTYSYGKPKKPVDAPPSHRTYQRLFRRLLREVVAGDNNGIRKLVVPSEVDTTRLREIVRREFRDGPASAHFDVATRRQVAFTALRELNKKLSYLDQLQANAPKPIPQQAAFNVSPLPTEPSSSYLQPGTFLVSHPYMNDSFFHKTVICILEHKSDNEVLKSSGRLSHSPQTHGVIVNRASINPETGENRTLREAFEQNSLPGRLSDIFGNSMVREGGPVHSALQMLHSAPATEEDGGGSGSDGTTFSMIGGSLIPTIPESVESSAAMFSDRATYFKGDTFKAASAVEEGTVDRDDVSFFVGTSVWSRGQLENEVAQGFWIPCRGPAEIAQTGICDHEPTKNSGSKRPLAHLWLSMMSACGEEEAKLAHLFYSEEWSENSLPCDAFDDDDDAIDVEIDPDYFM